MTRSAAASALTVSDAEGRRAVEEDERVGIGRRRDERVGEVALAAVDRRQLHRGGGELGLRGHEIEVGERGRLRELGERDAVEEVVRRDAVGAPAEAGGGVRLGVEIDEQAALAGLGEAGCEVDGGRRLPDSALLVRDCVDTCRHAPRLAGRGGRR